MREIGAFEAKNKLSALLDLVERGEEVTITRRGRPVARLVPPKPIVDRGGVKAALERLRTLAKKESHGPFDWAEWKAYVEEGRR